MVDSSLILSSTLMLDFFNHEVDVPVGVNCRVTGLVNFCIMLHFNKCHDSLL